MCLGAKMITDKMIPTYFLFLRNILIWDQALRALQKGALTLQEGRVTSWADDGESMGSGATTAAARRHKVNRVLSETSSRGQPGERLSGLPRHEISTVLFNTNMLICNIQLLSLCSSPHQVPAGIMLVFFFFFFPTNSAKSRLMALSVPPTFPPTHSFASGSNKLSNYSSSSSHRQLPNNTFGREERLLQACAVLPSPRPEQSLCIPTVRKANILEQRLANTLPFLPCQK